MRLLPNYFGQLFLLLLIPPGIAMLLAGMSICFTDITFFFKCRLCHSTTGGRITMRIVALTQSMKKLLLLQIW